jgi:hypothetical protein
MAFENPQCMRTFSYLLCVGFAHKLHTTLLRVSFWHVVWNKYINELHSRISCIRLLSNSQSRLNTTINAIQKMGRTRYCSLIRRLTSPHLKSGCKQVILLLSLSISSKLPFHVLKNLQVPPVFPQSSPPLDNK